MTHRVARAVTIAAVMMTLGAGHTASATSFFSDTHNDASRPDSFTDVTDPVARTQPRPAAAIALRNAQRERAVFGPNHPMSEAQVFNSAYVASTFELSSQPARAGIVRGLTEMALAIGVMAPDAAHLNLSTSYGAQGMFSTDSGISQATMTLPGFNIGSNVSASGGRGPSSVAAIPEPATALLLLTGAVGLLAARRR